MNKTDDEARHEDVVRSVLVVYITVQPLVLMIFFGTCPYVFGKLLTRRRIRHR